MQQSNSVSQQEVVARLERLPLSSWQIKTRVIVGTATFFDAFDALAIAFILPAIIPLWHLKPGDIGWLISMGYVGQLVGALVGGWLAERFGRRPVIVASIFWFGLFSIACAFAWNYESLLTLRTLQGLGLGAEVPVAATYISELARARGRGRFVLLFELVFPVGILAAALLGRWIVPHLGWQYMFYIGGLPALLALFMMRLMPESPRWLAGRGQFGKAEAALSDIETRVERATGARLPPPQATSITPSKMNTDWRDLFRGIYLRRTLVLWVCWFATYLANYGLTTWLPSVYQQVFKLPLEQSLSYGLISSALGLCGSLLCALFIDRVGRRIWFACAFFGSAIALLTLWYIGPTTPERVLICTTLSFMCISTLSLAMYLYTSELYPTRMRALGSGTATAWLRIASIIGPVTVGALVGTAGGLGTVFLLFGVVVLVAGVIVVAFGIETKGRVLEDVSP
ncbi:MFS transporter [Roseiarcaceae bacterium H3SJ34-1]|uniref:MFS transporter n=1 Tax=Terripilifer ovatus TaxID=3032367 RepID=UPI003AB97ABB|nr:MFS transporter [Roseiarcaceae bacterium H3SJ34-1]